jgi:hypothetical protein
MLNTRVAQRCLRLAFQGYELFCYAGTHHNAKTKQIIAKHALWIDHFGCEYLGANFNLSGLIRRITDGNNVVSIDKMMLQLMAHCEDHWIVR